MSPRRKPPGERHGDAIEAPSEYGFVTTDSPPPGAVRARRDRDAPSPGKGPLAPLWAGLKLTVGLAIVASISLAIAWGAHRYALTSPRFAIREFRVAGNRHHSEGQLTRLSGVGPGQNLFSVDTDAAEQRILESPWVKRAKVGRELPGTLRIEVEERDAVALAVIEDALYLVTREGEPFKELGDKDPSDLPVLTGIAGRDLAVDRARAVERLSVGLGVLREYATLPTSRIYEAEEVHLREDGSVVLTIGKRGITLHLGTPPVRQKLLMGARILAKLQPGGELPGILFLDNEAHPERVVVRMR